MKLRLPDLRRAAFPSTAAGFRPFAQWLHRRAYRSFRSACVGQAELRGLTRPDQVAAQGGARSWASPQPVHGGQITGTPEHFPENA
jgi:hypothetical protein